MPAPANQAHAVLLADDHHPVAVVFYFVQPVRAGGHIVRALVGSENAYSIVPVTLALLRLISMRHDLRVLAHL
jgi:hypothetical protein